MSKFIFLNAHSLLAQSIIDKLCINHDCSLITLDKNLPGNNNSYYIKQYPQITILDAYMLWAKIDLSSNDDNSLSFDSTNNRIPPLSSNEYQQVFYKVNRFLDNRENSSLGLSENSYQIIVRTIVRRAHYILTTSSPSIIATIFGPSTAFDVAIVALAHQRGIKFLAMKSTSMKGQFYFVSQPSDSVTSIIDISDFSLKSKFFEHSLSQAKSYILSPTATTHYVASQDPNINKSNYSYLNLLEQYKNRITKTATLYSDKIATLDSSVTPENITSLLRLKHNTSKRFTHIFNNYDHRILKSNIFKLHDRQKARILYINYLIEHSKHYFMSKASKIIIFMDYTPELARYPFGGDYYHWSCLVEAALHLKHCCKGLSNYQIFFKEHPNMLEPSRANHSYPRDTEFFRFMDLHNIQPIPHTVTTRELINSQEKFLTVCSSKGAGLELLLKGYPVITTSKPFWLRFNGSFYFDPISLSLYSFDSSENQLKVQPLEEDILFNNQPLCWEDYFSYLKRYCIGTDLDNRIDTLLEEPDSLEFSLNINRVSDLYTLVLQQLTTDI